MTEPGSTATVFLVTRLAFGREGEALSRGRFQVTSRVPCRSFRHRPAAEAFVTRELSALRRSCNPFRHATMTTWDFYVRLQPALVRMLDEAGVPAAPRCADHVQNECEVLATWWDGVVMKLSGEQVQQVWDACDHFGFFEIVELPWED